MNATLENGVLTIQVPVNGTDPKKLPKSKSGKTYLVAAPGAQKTGIKIGEKVLTISLSAYIPA